MRRLALGFLWSNLLWFLSACASQTGAATDPKEDKPGVEIRLSHSIAHAPAYVRVTAIVKDPKQTLHCPGFTILWGDGCTSAAQDDCDPYGRQEDRPYRYALTPPVHPYRLAGEYAVTVQAKEGDEVRFSGTATLIVVGPAPLSELRS